jgi:hypothetical protein
MGSNHKEPTAEIYKDYLLAVKFNLRRRHNK